MKHQSYIRSLFVAFCAFFVCVSALAETTAEAATVHLNPFAFKLSSSLNGDVFTVTYYLNAPATNVDVIVDIDGDGVDADDVVYNCNAVKNTNETPLVKGIYTADISLREKINDVADFRDKTNLRWYVDVKGGNTAQYTTCGDNGGTFTTLNAPKVTSYSYLFGRPSSVDIDNDPFSDNFGIIYMVDANKNPDAPSGGTKDQYFSYRGTTYTPGLYLFDAAFQNYPVYEQYYDFENYTIANAKNEASAYTMNQQSKTGAFSDNLVYGRVRISHNSDHTTRVFMSFMSKSGMILGEAFTNNDHDATFDPIPGLKSGKTDWFRSVVSTTADNVSEDASGNFIAGPNVVFDTYGESTWLKLLMISGRYQGGATSSREAFRCDEYVLGTNTTIANKPWRPAVMNMRKSTKPTDVNWWYANNRTLVSSSSLKGTEAVGFSNTYDQRGLEYDEEGTGFWHVQYREAQTELPSLVHFRLKDATTGEYEVNFAEYRAGRNGAAVRYDKNHEHLLVAGGRPTTKTATISYYKEWAHLSKNPWPSGVTDNFPHKAVEEKWATIYTIDKTKLNANLIDNYTDNTKSDWKETSTTNRVKLFTDSVYLNAGGLSVFDVAWDYANNLYLASGYNHEFCAFALPNGGKPVSTPCRDESRFNTPTCDLTITVAPSNKCGEVVDDEFQKSFSHYLKNATFQLLAKPKTGYRFYCWDEYDIKYPNTIGATLTSPYTITSDYSRTAHFGLNVWETEPITQTDEQMTFRGLWVQRELDDVSYSTICLPFNLTTLEGTPYEGASVLKFDEAEDSDVAGDNRTFLTFKEVTFTNGDIMEAGKPYLIKVNTPIAKGEEKIFNNVTCPPIGSEGGYVTKGNVTFHGLLNPTTFTKEKVKDKLFLTADNRLVSLYGQDSFTINGLRGYFTVKEGAKNVEYMLNLPEKVTTSIPMVNIADSLKVTKYLWNGQIYIQRGNQVYDLSGARVK